jgi:hypothetical protein
VRMVNPLSRYRVGVLAYARKRASWRLEAKGKARSDKVCRYVCMLLLGSLERGRKD